MDDKNKEWFEKEVFIREKKWHLEQGMTEEEYNRRLKEIQEKEKQKIIDNLREAMKNFDFRYVAERFVEIQPLHFDRNQIWWLWENQEKKWERIDETDILNSFDDNTSIKNTINSKIKNEILEALKRIGRKKEPKPIKKTWIQFKDKIIDVENSEQINPSPEYFVTNPIPQDIGESEDTPTINRIFSEWVGPQNVELLYEIIAYCMLPNYPIHRIFCLVGSGMNGKSKFFQLLKKIIGEENFTSTELDVLLQSRFESGKLFKKLVCIMGETNFNHLSKTSLLKRLTGQDLVSFEFKGKQPFDDENYAKILIATNTLPITFDKTDGFYRRWQIIDFPNKFTEKKDILKDIPEIEYSNLTKKSVRILKELLDKREFINEGSVEERAKQYENHSNPLKTFIHEKCIRDVNGKIALGEFYEFYKSFLTERGYRIQTYPEFVRLVSNEGFEKKKEHRDKGDGQRTTINFVIGIKWKEGEKRVDTQDTLDTHIPTSFLHEEKEIESAYPSEKTGYPAYPKNENSLTSPTITQEVVVAKPTEKQEQSWEDLGIFPTNLVYLPCATTSCPNKECHYEYKGKPFCKDCAGKIALMLNWASK